MKPINIVINGNPITKKNHMNLIKVKGRIIPIQSKAYRDYEKLFILQCKYKNLKIDYPVNIACRYYMETKRRVDLTNLLSATMDCLVKAGVIKDDNYLIAAANDGSRVFFDSKNPRVEITITKMTKNDYEFHKNIMDTIQIEEIHNEINQLEDYMSKK